MNLRLLLQTQHSPPIAGATGPRLPTSKCRFKSGPRSSMRGGPKAGRDDITTDLGPQVRRCATWVARQGPGAGYAPGPAPVSAVAVVVDIAYVVDVVDVAYVVDVAFAVDVIVRRR